MAEARTVPLGIEEELDEGASAGEPRRLLPPGEEASGEEETRFREVRYRRTLRREQRAGERKLEFTPTGLAKSLVDFLNHQIELGNDVTVFLIAILLAVFKDLADLQFLTLAGPITTFISVALTLFLVGKGWFLRRQARIWWWLIGLIIDIPPFISAAPINTIMVFLAWRTVRKDAEEAQGHMKRVHTMSEAEMRNLANAEGLEAV